MNYRHAFHAGNFADVFKHTLLLALLDALNVKPAAWCYVDTHAGRGLYDLGGDEAARTGEAGLGVQRLLVAEALPPALQRYVDVVRACATPERPHAYPGSPLVAQQCLREQDRAIACEIVAEEATALKSALRGDRRYAIHQRDGYAALGAVLPPPQKRGLVLIDPPFEAQGGEFDAICAALDVAFARWPNAIYAVWFPIKLRETILPFYRRLYAAYAPADVLAIELLVHAPVSPLRLNGCGIALLNPPWRFDEAVRAWLPRAAALLSQEEPATHRVDWLRKR